MIQKVNLTSKLMAVTMIGIACSSSLAAAVKRYAGKLNNKPVVFYIDWHNNGRVTGAYIYRGVRYWFSGDNHREGRLRLTDEDGDRIILVKHLSAKRIYWKGTVNGNQVVSVSRKR